jgi:hypothetical protein
MAFRLVGKFRNKIRKHTLKNDLKSDFPIHQVNHHQKDRIHR